MPSDRPGAGDDEFSVRLAWPAPGSAAAADDDDVDEEPTGELAAIPLEPSPPRPAPAGPAARPSAPSAWSATPVSASPVARPQPAPAAQPPSRPRPAPAPASAGSEPSPSGALELAGQPGDGTRPGRVFVEAFDRLADRLLERLRSLRQDIDADLAVLRAELAGVRQAVDDVGDRVQLRQLRQTLDELRSDVVGLRRAVLEGPQMEQVASDVAAIRQDLSYLFETGGSDGDPALAPSRLLEDLQEVIDALAERSASVSVDAPQVAVLAPLVEEVASMRGELTSLRRRMQLRTGPLDEEQLEQIVAAVAARVAEELGDRRSKRR